MKFYIKESDLQAIMAGSFEARRKTTMEAVDVFEKGPTQLKRPLSLVATFEQHAVVVDASGSLFRYVVAEGKVVSREAYPGFKALTEEEAKKDTNSILERAAAELADGKDLTASIVELLRK